jgi:hypothetical protein
MQIDINFHYPQYQSDPDSQTKRVRFVIPEEVVMQPRLMVGVLVLQAEGLACGIHYLGFLFQATLASIVPESQQVAAPTGFLTQVVGRTVIEAVGFAVIMLLKLLN